MFWSRISLCFILLFLTTTSAQAPVYSYNSCMNSTSISPTYKTNVKSLLSWITNDSSISKGFNYTTISSNNGGDNDGYGDAVYGLYSCRYDITGYFCQFCLTTAVNEISRLCPDSVTAILWYDVCILRYSNQSFHGKVSLSPTWNVTGPRKIKVIFEYGIWKIQAICKLNFFRFLNFIWIKQFNFPVF